MDLVIRLGPQREKHVEFFNLRPPAEEFLFDVRQLRCGQFLARAMC